MELWVRSQNKEDLMKAENIGVFNEKIYVNGYEENGYCIGTYKTKERALEVLDEIQEMDFKSNSNVKLTSYGYVYEMPKE